MLFSVHRMLSTPNASRYPRLLTVTSGALLALGGAVWALASVLRETSGVIFGPGRVSVDELVTALSATGALVLITWVTLGLLISILAVIPGPWAMLSRRVEDYLVPAAVRRWAALLLGAAVVSTLAPAGASAVLPDSGVSISSPVAPNPASAPSPGWAALADPPAGEPSAPAPMWTPSPTRDLPPVSLTRQREPEDAGREVTVRRGDTLWDLAAAHLPAEATDAEIAAAWQEWHAVNREVIGPDPDLILPGQLLRVPTHQDAVAEVSP